VRPFHAVIAAAIVLSGCTIEQPLPKRWTRPDTTPEMFMQDRNACAQQAQQAQQANSAGSSVPSLASCLVTRGYKEDTNGNLSAPSGPPTVKFSSGVLAPALEVIKGSVGSLSPQYAARQRYDRSAADYRNCLAANLSNADACDGQRQVLQADQEALSASSK
jgi:hypothetical protein